VRGANVRLHSFQLEEMGSNGHGATSGMHTGLTGAPGDAAAYQRGIVEGERRAREQAGPVHERQQALLASAVTAFERARAMTIKKAEEEVADLALAIASKIVHESVDEKRDLVQRQVREAIARVRDSREVLIRVHPEDRASIECLRAALVLLFEGPVTMKIEGDLGVARGGCVLETPTRLIDATIDAQLARLGEALKRDL
jgi:flagellar biosynthesis/type III secretory pathway protein FliH